MKLQLLASALVIAAFAAAPASAMISKHNLDTALNAAVFNGDVTGVVNGDTVTIFGKVEGAYEANKVRQAALGVEGVAKVISRFSAYGAGL